MASPKIYKLVLEAADKFWFGASVDELYDYIRKNFTLKLSDNELKKRIKLAVKTGIQKKDLEKSSWSNKIRRLEKVKKEPKKPAQKKSPVFKATLNAAKKLNRGKGGTLLEIYDYIRKHTRLQMEDNALKTELRETLQKTIKDKKVFIQDFETKRYSINKKKK